MISNYRQITWKYLKSNKKRTLLTIIGIILSVALISSIGLFLKGIEEAQIDDAKNNFGAYHLAYTKADEQLISKISNNPKVSRSGLITKGESVSIGDKISTNIVEATDKALELLPYRIKDGRLPDNKSEIAVEKWILPKLAADAKLGNKVKINNKEYTLVGILQDNASSQLDQSGVILTKDNNLKGENTILLVEISSKALSKTTVNELKQLVSKDTVGENSYLLLSEGVSNENSGMMGLYMAIAVIIGIVLIATIAVIYNSFQISVVERMKQFGLLRAIGTTPKQIRSIVLREASIVAAIAVPMGLLCGIIAIYGINIAFKLIGGSLPTFTKAVVDPKILGISAGVGLASVYISAWIPAFSAGRISPLVAISSRTLIKKEKIKKRKSLIVGKLFGFEGEIASKNIKRNRKRYRITVFSIIISVVLFITFKSFTDMAFGVSSKVNESNNINFSVFFGGENENTVSKDILSKIEQSKYTTKVYERYYPLYFKAAIDKDKEIKEAKNIPGVYTNMFFQGKESALVNAYVEPYDNKGLEVSKKYLESGNIDIEKINNENGVILVNKNKVKNTTTDKTYVGPTADIKVGDEIYLQLSEAPDNKSVEFGKGSLKKVKVMAILKDDPFNSSGGTNGLKLISTENVAKQLADKDKINLFFLDIIIDDVKNEDVAKTAIENAVNSNPSVTVINRIDSNRQQKTYKLMIEILMYGFVIVVSLISSVNIINTMTTNIILRRREFATLKSIGLTQRGLRKMIVLEGLMYGVSGVVYGSIIGCGVSYMLFSGLSGVREFGWIVPWNAIIIAAICALIIGYLSVLSPLSRINKDNLIDIIREE